MMSDRNADGGDDEFNDVQYIDEDKNMSYRYIDNDDDDNDVQLINRW